MAYDHATHRVSRHRYERVVALHVKDRKKGQGPNTPWGQGDTPVREVLQILKKTRWKIPANIECAYKVVAHAPTTVRNRKHVKRLPELRRQNTVLPKTVRYHEIEKAALFPGGLPREQPG